MGPTGVAAAVVRLTFRHLQSQSAHIWFDQFPNHPPGFKPNDGWKEGDTYYVSVGGGVYVPVARTDKGWQAPPGWHFGSYGWEQSSN